MDYNKMNQLLNKMTEQERKEVEAFAAFVIIRRSLENTQVLTDDISVQELADLALKGGAFDWLKHEREDVYSIKDGEVALWEDA